MAVTWCEVEERGYMGLCRYSIELKNPTIYSISYFIPTSGNYEIIATVNG